MLQSGYFNGSGARPTGSPEPPSAAAVSVVRCRTFPRASPSSPFRRLPVIDLLTAVWLGFLGACIGSFLNVVAYRLPLGMSVVWRPSHCPRCDHPIRPYDNVPILGWLWLRGKCRDCGAPISPRYAIVETVLGAVAFLLAYVELFSGGANLPGGPLADQSGALRTVWIPHGPLLATYGLHLLLMAALTTIVLFDLDQQSIPKRFGVVVLAAMLLVVLYGNVYHPAPGVESTGPRQAQHASLGILVLVASAAIHFAAAKNRNVAPNILMLQHRSKAFLAGAFVLLSLGLTATPTFLALWGLVSCVVRACGGRSRSLLLSTTAAAWCVALVHIVFWRQLAELSPW
ncbi:MAG: prepilin peptidase [Pirellulales bacterium]|nr:prepilin peptidase [Pirellulales bacterium]